jgi:hypothetical protein
VFALRDYFGEGMVTERSFLTIARRLLTTVRGVRAWYTYTGARLMKSHRVFLAAALLCSALACGRAQDAAPSPYFPFVLPWDDAAKTVIDVSHLNPTPAGVNGRIVAKNGHFYDGKNNRVRFVGVNIVATACFPEKPVAEKIAARMHKFGINIVRLHHMDAAWSRPNLFDESAGTTQKFNDESLDRLDYLVSQLKKNGIYVNINLHVSRSWTTGDGLPEPDKLGSGGKPAPYFFPRMIDLQKDFARRMLSRKNPYTDLTYAEDPAVAIVEITNENTLLGEAWGQGIENMPAPYKQELQRLWNAWLKKKYNTTDGIRRAWSAQDKPLGPNRLANAAFETGAERWNLELNTAPAEAKMSFAEEAPPPGVKSNVLRLNVTQLTEQNWHIQFHQTGLDLTENEPYTVSFWAKADRERPMGVYTSLDKEDWHNVGLQSNVTLTREWKRYTLAFTASRVAKDHNRLTFVLGDALGTVDLADIRLQPGVETEFPKGVSVEAGTMPLGKTTSNPAGVDWLNFLMEVEAKFMTTMYDFLKKEVGLKAMVSGSQANFGGLGGALRESRLDFVDAHAYWQHPEFPRQPWDVKDWRIGNTAMVRDKNGGELSSLAQFRVANKPYTVSEYNHPAPNDYRAECVPMLAAFAAFQDWDGFYLFDYNADRTAYDSDRVKNFFSVDSDPARMALLPAAALLFCRNDMALAKNELRLRVPLESVAGQMLKSGRWNVGVWSAAGLSRADALTQRLSLNFAGKPSGGASASRPPENIVNARPTTNAISWETNTEKPVFSADSPFSKVMVGFLGGQSVAVGNWLVRAGETPHNFAALTLSALDSQPIEQSRSLLLTAVGRVENIGMGWNADRTSVGDQWGTGPVQCEGISALVTLPSRATSVTVYALDGTGKRKTKVESKLSEGTLTFTIGPAYQTLWYEIESKH